MKNEDSKSLRRNPKTGRLPGESKRKTASGYRTIFVACGTDITEAEAHAMADCMAYQPTSLILGQGNVDIRKHGSQK